MMQTPDPSSIAEQLERYNRRRHENAMRCGDDIIDSLLSLIKRQNEALEQSYDKLILECGGSREYRGGIPTQVLFPRVEEAIREAAPIIAVMEKVNDRPRNR